jgi:hypothetical protein
MKSRDILKQVPEKKKVEDVSTQILEKYFEQLNKKKQPINKINFQEFQKLVKEFTEKNS